MVKKIKEKKVFLVITTIIIFLIIAAIAYLIFQKKPSEERTEPTAPTITPEALEEAKRKKILEGLTSERKEPMSEEEKKAREEILESLTSHPE